MACRKPGGESRRNRSCRRGQPLELDGKDKHEHGTQPEVGNGDGKQRCGGEQVIQPGIPLECGEDAQRNAHQYSDEDSGR